MFAKDSEGLWGRPLPSPIVCVQVHTSLNYFADVRRFPHNIFLRRKTSGTFQIKFRA